MNITPDVWASLRRAAQADDERIFQHLVRALLEEALRQDRVQRAANLPTDGAFLYCQR